MNDDTKIDDAISNDISVSDEEILLEATLAALLQFDPFLEDLNDDNEEEIG